MSVVWYWVKIADELTGDDSKLLFEQAGLHLLDAAPYEPGDGRSRWWRVGDRNASPEFGAKRVELIVSTVDGMPVVTERRLLDA